MRNLMIPGIVLIAALLVVMPTIGTCGSNVDGTYTNTGGMVTLDLRSGGKAGFTMMGETMPCTYKVKENKVMLDCTPKGEKVDFIIHDDGSLTGPGFIGNMKKSK
ncbi:MAG: hypothetical protein ABJB49_07835 [Nitrospirota bacterium]